MLQAPIRGELENVIHEKVRMLLEERGAEAPAVHGAASSNGALGLSSLDLAIVVAELESRSASILFPRSYRSPAFVRSTTSSELTSRRICRRGSRRRATKISCRPRDERAAGALVEDLDDRRFGFGRSGDHRDCGPLSGRGGSRGFLA